MSFIKNLFAKKPEPIHSYDDFWNWFRKKEKTFFNVVKERGDIEKVFFNPLSDRLCELREGYWYLTGMCNPNTAELIITADGIIKNIVFVEELIEAAPAIEGWKFTALKPAFDIKHISIELLTHQFHEDNLHFYANNPREYPDEIEITVVYDDFDEKSRTDITNGIYIFLENFLGELDFATTIDLINVSGREEATGELIPIAKIKDYLQWRQKEFVEKYEGTRHNTENDNYSILEARLESGNTLIAVINTDLLKWDAKASHPWLLRIEIPYDGSRNNGMPVEGTIQQLNEIENRMMQELKDSDGYLNIGRQTAENTREIYFACKEFRKPSKVVSRIQNEYAGQLEISWDIYKDKYWQSYNRFIH